MGKTLKRNLSYDDRNHLYYVSLYYDGEDGRRVRRTRTYPTMSRPSRSSPSTAVSGRALEKAPKSYASERRLAFGGSEDLEALLKRLYRDWERRRKQDPKYNPEGYVAVNEAGKPYQPDVLCQRIAQFIAAQGLPPISLHGLRHSFASVANSQNVPMFSISKALGHSSTSVTSAVYMHLFDDAVADVVSQVASAITGAEP